MCWYCAKNIASALKLFSSISCCGALKQCQLKICQNIALPWTVAAAFPDWGLNLWLCLVWAVPSNVVSNESYNSTFTDLSGQLWFAKGIAPIPIALFILWRNHGWKTCSHIYFFENPMEQFVFSCSNFSWHFRWCSALPSMWIPLLLETQMVAEGETVLKAQTEALLRQTEANLAALKPRQEPLRRRTWFEKHSSISFFENNTSDLNVYSKHFFLPSEC